LPIDRRTVFHYSTEDMKAIKAVLFDFGGVLAEEGFRRGLEAIALQEGRDPVNFFLKAQSLIYSTGYVLGRADESSFWGALKEETGIGTAEGDLHRAVLDRFLLRPDMIALVRDLKGKGYLVSILSDQTDWLEILDRKLGIYRHFDRVYNSFRSHRSKRDPYWFTEICADLGLAPSQVVFTDDNEDNVTRAAAMGLRAIHFQYEEQFRKDLARYIDIAETGRGDQ
jgi:putative hydrolase of the HAD superfamily